MESNQTFTEKQILMIEDAILKTAGQPCPKLEKIKPMIPSMIQHLKNIGWIEDGGVKGQ
jgi:hypothetical protein